MIFKFLDKRLLLCWDLICIRITCSPLHLDIHICTSMVLHIDVYKEIYCIFQYFIFTLIFKEIYTYSASNKPELSEIYLIEITCHRIIIISLLVAANDAQSTKCYHGLTIMFNPKILRLIVDLARVCWKFRWPLPNPFARFHWINFWTHGTWSPWPPFCFPYIT